MTPDGMDAFIRRQAGQAIRAFAERVERDPWLISFTMSWKLGDQVISGSQHFQPYSDPVEGSSMTFQDPSVVLSGSAVVGSSDDRPPNGSSGSLG